MVGIFRLRKNKGINHEQDPRLGHPRASVHWTFTASPVASIGIGFLVDDHRPPLQLHMVFGVVTSFLLAVSVVLGFVGSRYLRFSSHPVHPCGAVAYMISAVASKTKLYAGNNPGSAIAAAPMFLLVPVLFLSGIGFGGEAKEELHELCAWTLLAAIAMRLAGLASAHDLAS